MEVIFDSPLGKRLRELRKRSGLSVREMAARLGKSPGYVSRIEARGDVPSAELLCNIAEVHEVKAERLLELAKRSQLERLELELEAKYAGVLVKYQQIKMQRKKLMDAGGA